MPIEAEPFELAGQDAGAWRLTNRTGTELRVASLGGAILSIRTPDREGRIDDVALGYATPESYARNPSYLGVLVGRYANRIAGARFVIDGREHRLERNDGDRNHLHGGLTGFSRVAWSVQPFERGGEAGLVLEHTSPDGAGGYPGELRIRATYTLTDANELIVDYDATTSAPTHLNPTQHTYFNLAGHGAGRVHGHVLEIAADRFVVAGEGLIPTDELRDVTGTPFDFRTPTPIGARIDGPDAQLRAGHGYDHCFVLRGSGAGAAADRAAGHAPSFAARVFEPGSGRVLSVHTTEPGMQLYTGNWLGDGELAKDGATYGPRSGFALETQHFPDSPNRPEFPSTLLRPGEDFRSRTVYTFGVE